MSLWQKIDILCEQCSFHREKYVGDIMLVPDIDFGENI